MIEQDILDKVASEGWEVIKTDDKLGQEGDHLYKGLLIAKPMNGTMLRKWINYVLLPDNSCYWREVNPFPVKPVRFSQDVQAAISGFITAGQIKAGYVERLNQLDETAIVVAVMSDDTFRMFHIYKDSGNIQRTEITGNYPMNPQGV